MNRMDKKALKAAVLGAVIVLAVIEGLFLLIHFVDPQGGLLQVDIANPLHHVILVIAAVIAGIIVYRQEHAKTGKS